MKPRKIVESISGYSSKLTFICFRHTITRNCHSKPVRLIDNNSLEIVSKDKRKNVFTTRCLFRCPLRQRAQLANYYASSIARLLLCKM